MSIFHMHAQVIGRGGRRSAVAASAYRAACKLLETIIDKETGISFEVVHDYSKKGGVVFSAIFAPDFAPSFAQDRQVLWNKIQNEFDTRKNAQFCREIEISLAAELSIEENTRLLTEFVKDAFVNEGMIADVNFHNDNPDNPHAHIMLSMREIVEDKDNPGDYTFGLKVRYWNSNEFILHLRRLWAGYINKHLAIAGIDQEVSHLSHEARGIELTPTIKEGVGLYVRGAERASINQEIKADNLRRIKEDPTLILDAFRKNKVVFSKEDITKELFTLYAESTVLDDETQAIDKSQDNQDSKSESSDESSCVAEIKDTSKIEELGQKSLSSYIEALDKVMSSDKLVLLSDRDINGKRLYTFKARYDLEQDFVKTMVSIKNQEASALHKDKEGPGGEADKRVTDSTAAQKLEEGSSITHSNSHSLGLDLKDLEKQTLLEKAIDTTKTLAKEYLGFDYNRIKLSSQQKQVAIEVLNASSVSVIEGLPGTGKTSIMKEIVNQYKKAGYSPIAVAVSNSASRELGKATGMDAMNITQFRYKTENLAFDKFKLNLAFDYYADEVNPAKRTLLSPKHVLIVDEASMVDLTEMHYIMKEVATSGAKLIVLGDNNQLSAVGSSGAASKVAEIFGASYLDEVKRQENPLHREATILLSKFEITKAIEIYKKTNSLSFYPTIDKAKDSLVKDYVDQYLATYHNPKEKSNLISGLQVALAYTNKDISELNQSIRTRLVDRGAIIGSDRQFVITKQGSYQAIEIAKKEQIVFTKNNKFLGVSNGDIGTVVGFRVTKDLSETILVELQGDKNSLFGKNGRIVEIDNSRFKGFDYGYAITAYKAQGKTYNHTFALMDGHMGYNIFNVVATRHIDSFTFYIGEDIVTNELYKRIDLDTKKAKSEFAVISTKKIDGKTLPAPELEKYAGLASLLQKRSATSLSIDYQRISPLEKERCETLSRYIDTKSEVMKLMQASNNWLKLEKLKSSAEINYQDTPFYEELSAALEERRQLATLITDNKIGYKQIITQSKLNYATIEKHAGKSEYSYYFEARKNKNSALPLRGFARVLEIQSQFSKDTSTTQEVRDALAIELKDITHTIRTEFTEHQLAIFQAEEELQGSKEQKDQALLYIEDGNHYINKAIGAHLCYIYREGAYRALDKWEKLKQEKAHNIKEALESIKQNPKILGRLKGLGLGNMFAFTNDRIKAIDNISNLPQKLEKYEKYIDEIPQLQSKLINKEFDQEIAAKEIELKTLKAKLPNQEVQDFIEKAYQASIDTRKDALSIWAQEPLTKLQGKAYRERLANPGQTQTPTKYQVQDYTKLTPLVTKKEKEAYLRNFEYSTNMDPQSKLERRIAGITKPDIAYNILKYTCFKEVQQDISPYTKAIFVIVGGDLQKSDITKMKNQLLSCVQETIAPNAEIIEILTKEEAEYADIQASIKRIITPIAKEEEKYKDTRDMEYKDTRDIEYQYNYQEQEQYQQQQQHNDFKSLATSLNLVLSKATNNYNNQKQNNQKQNNQNQREVYGHDITHDKANISPNNTKDIITRSEEYAIEHIAIYNKSPNYLELRQIVERATYEIENKSGWVHTLTSDYYSSLEARQLSACGTEEIDEERYVLSAGERILIDQQSNRLSSIHSRLYIDAMANKLSNQKIDKITIAREAQELESTRGVRINQMLRENSNVKHLAKIDKVAARNMAEQIVDYGLRHGDAKAENLPEHHIELMKNISLEQSKAIKQVDHDFTQIDISCNRPDKQKPNSNKHTQNNKIFTQHILDTDKHAARVLTKVNICNYLTKEASIFKIDKLDARRSQVMRCQQSKLSMESLKHLQKIFKQERQQEIKQTKQIEL
ncbi:MAG: hypothetical protein EB127_03990 [Alphaproteobacteria bacterium]|nr:hypothetical protein [Alphaproteobacteria bacterium]